MGYKDFFDSLLPGNYALTKSMELTKKGDSGTLWYTKKYLTLYYYIFLSNEILNTSYVDKVAKIFEVFVDSVDENVKESARLYFFPEVDDINFNSDNFKTFVDFANRNKFSSNEERNTYYNNAKKCYFAFLMGTGGQAGVKKFVVNAIKNPEFHYDASVMKKIILEAVIATCVEKGNNSDGDIGSGDIARILSKKAIDEIKSMIALGNVSEMQIQEIVNKFPCSDKYPGEYNGNSFTYPQYSGVESDSFASVRNERQILYYYGYFHSKTTGATEFEFSSLTPIGELAIQANYREFLAIWEHQKVKMISQPVTVNINNIEKQQVDTNKFGINISPYTDILGTLSRRKSLSLDEYKYILSRKKDTLSDWQSYENELFDHLSEIKTRVQSFGRKGDIKDEDARKELLKYILGIRNDLPKDSKTNPLGLISFNGAKVTVQNYDSLALLYKLYSNVEEYKKIRYKDIYVNSLEDLRKHYIASIQNIKQEKDKKVKIQWDLYNIHVDKFIMLITIIAISAISIMIKDFDTINNEEVENICKYAKENFNVLLRALGIVSPTALKREVSNIITALKNNDYSLYLRIDEERGEQVLAAYRTESIADLQEKIHKISTNSISELPNRGRVRNMTLVRLLKSYYLNKFAENDKLKCECCGKETFITNSGEPYIEFHHLIPFSVAYGPDHYLNLFALCPNCHRKIHFLKIEDKGKEYANLSNNNYLQQNFVERMLELKEQNILKSYHLEFLFSDNAISQEEYNKIAA